MKLLRMIFLALIVSACSSPKADSPATAKQEFAQFAKMAETLDNEFIDESRNFLTENGHLTGDKAKKAHLNGLRKLIASKFKK